MSDDEINNGDQEQDFDFAGTGEFEIGESPDDDELGDELMVGDPDSGELGDDDLAELGLDQDDDMTLGSPGPEDDLSDGAEAAASDNGEQDDAGGDDNNPDPDEAMEQSGSRFGWKSYAAVVLLLAVVGGGSMMMLVGGNNAPQQQVRAPQPSGESSSVQGTSAKTGDDGSNGGPSTNNGASGSGSNSGGSVADNGSAPQESAPQVQAFPEPDSKSDAAQKQTAQASEDSGREIAAGQPFDPEPVEAQAPTSEPIRQNRATQPTSSMQLDGQVSAITKPLDEVEQTLGKNTEQLEALSGIMNQSQQRLDKGFTSVTDKLATINEQVSRLADRLSGGDAGTDSKEPSSNAGGDTDEGGDTNDATKSDSGVRTAQIRLKAFGYQPGPIDGIYGKRTAAATERFQKAHDLTVNGELNEATMERLMSENVVAWDGGDSGSGTDNGSGQDKDRRTGQVMARTQQGNDGDWFVRGVTSGRAIIYKPDGSSYTVEPGTEIPGKGQVAKLNPEQHAVVLVGGETLRRR